MDKRTAIDACYTATPDEWKEKAWKFTLRFLQHMKASGEAFSAEDVRRYCAFRKLPERDGRAFGAIMQKLARSGLIRVSGLAETSNPKAHSRLVTKWRVV